MKTKKSDSKGRVVVGYPGDEFTVHHLDAETIVLKRRAKVFLDAVEIAQAIKAGERAYAEEKAERNNQHWTPPPVEPDPEGRRTWEF